jgi:beta-glucosidase/6-phospho-beta-glucosidase/beta-galactosidase
VPTWTTLNEPFCSSLLGYSAGHHAPGRQEGVAGLVSAHHLLLGHGLVLDALKGKDEVRWGISLNCTVADPATDDDADLDAARAALSTSTIKDTVGRALREAAASAARRREVERLLDGSSALLAGGDDRDRAWR